MATTDFQVQGTNTAALFTLKIHRGEGMALLAMNWKDSSPPNDFVGFAIEYKEPDGQKFFSIKNRLSFDFDAASTSTDPNRLSSLRAPIQKFRWVHFPRNADMDGAFTYRVKPVFMNNKGELNYGEAQQADIVLHRETYPGLLNVTFTRGFVSSQAFVDRYGKDSIPTLLPAKATLGLNFVPTHNKKTEALEWMGFEARASIFEVLDAALADPTAQVRVVAYDLNVPDMVSKIEQLKGRVSVIIDDSGEHGHHDSAETEAFERIKNVIGEARVKRQHMGSLQHNKMIVVSGDTTKAVVFGSTNFSWRGLYVQANNALVVHNEASVKIAMQAFEDYWNNDKAKDFGKTGSALWQDLQLPNIKAKVAFSPHIASNALLDDIAKDIQENTSSSLFYSMAFLYLTTGVLRTAIETVTANKDVFVYGMSDREVEGIGAAIEIQKPGSPHNDSNIAPVFPSGLTKDSVPEPFKSEPIGGGGIRLHHKFVVIDFDKPTARVYLGSYNFSDPADRKNGENLVLIQDRRVATAYMIEALRLFDHYHFRLKQAENEGDDTKKLSLQKPPTENSEPWWKTAFTEGDIKSRDRELFG